MCNGVRKMRIALKHSVASRRASNSATVSSYDFSKFWIKIFLELLMFMLFSIIIKNKCYYQIKFDLGLLSALFGMGGGPGKKIRQFSLKTEACASSYGLLQFWCFDTKGPRAAAGAFFCLLKHPPRPQALFFRKKTLAFVENDFVYWKRCFSW